MDKRLKHFRYIFVKFVACSLTILYTFSLIVSLIAGVSHELHHILSHTLDQHHHHGESHTSQTDHKKIHQHNDLVDTLLDDAKSQKDEKKDRHLFYDQRIFDHIGIKFSGDRLIYFEDHDSLTHPENNIYTQFLTLPDIPPPKV
jgi:hypothetical protein